MTDHHQSIPLNKLVAWDGNVRKTEGADTALAELAASIAGHGLLQSLVVRKDKRGKYAVVAGRRRLLALTLLAEEGRIDFGMEIPCRVIGEDELAAEISLAENAVRENMHPADEFEAFRDLIDSGASIADVAARFGYSESAVQKRLRLARVSPVIIAAYREGEIGLEEVMAFAVSDDQAAQERIWSEAPPWMRSDARAIREALTENDIAATDRRVQFVGLKAYEKAGGATRRDLFSEGDEGVFILDAALLSQLALKKLEKTAKAVRKEVWKWVEIHPAFGHAEALVLLVALGLVVYGIYAVKTTPVDAIPDLSENQVIIFTEWMGRDPRIIEDQITYPLVSNLQGIPRVKNIRANSMFGMSFVFVIFNDDVDIYWARTRVLERLNYAQRLLPEGATPTLGPDGTGLGHVFWYTLDAPGHDLGDD